MLPISRRQLLGFFAGLLVPDLRAGIPEITHESATQPTGTSFLVPDSNDQSALEAWKRLPMLPLVRFKDFSSAVQTDEDLFLGRMILGHIQSQTDFEFRYLGGSEAGNLRRAIPILLFKKFGMPHDHHHDPHVYLLAHCQTRQQARTFRLDRISTP